MLNLESFVHRESLSEILARWMINAPQSGDVRRLKTVVNFNSYFARIWVHELASAILCNLHGQVPVRTYLHSKGRLKDFVVDHPTYTNKRIEQMIAHYRRFPEDYYRNSPIDGSFYVIDVHGSPFMIGGTRIKRFRRIAEKGSRRIVDFVVTRIRANADALASERARDAGIPLSRLITTPEIMAAEFAHAERRVIKSIKKGTIHSELPVLDIPDVVGIKLIVENDEYARLIDAIESTKTCEILEAERHTGAYNAVNLKIAHKLPKALLAGNPPSGQFRKILAYRGFDPESIDREYKEFLNSAEDEVIVEVIVSNFQEYMESEIGRCMHEERVLEQRANPDYSGHLATNVRYMMTYVLGLCRAPGMNDISEVPIQLWVKYMPDTIEHIMRALYLSDDMYFDTLKEEG